MISRIYKCSCFWQILHFLLQMFGLILILFKLLVKLLLLWILILLLLVLITIYVLASCERWSWLWDHWCFVVVLRPDWRWFLRDIFVGGSWSRRTKWRSHLALMQYFNVSGLQVDVHMSLLAESSLDNAITWSLWHFDLDPEWTCCLFSQSTSQRV